MVQMLCGNLAIPQSQWVSALFGYFVGWMVALKSYELGLHAAVALHRKSNPKLAAEANHIRSQQVLGILVHRDLPELERRFLQNFENEIESENLRSKVELLQQWKEQTTNHRGGAYWAELREIEQTVLVRDEDPREELMEIAQDAGWDVSILRQWKDHSKSIEENAGDDLTQAGEKAFVVETQLHAVLLFLSTCFLVWGFVALKNPEASTVMYRTNFLSTMLSPFGTLLRWVLSNMNGSIRRKDWEWLPLGTLTVNLLAAAISALVAALTLQTTDITNKMWGVAMKTGFAGSLSTVSTFVAETEGLLRVLPQHLWGYYYSFGSLLLACIVGIIFYSWAAV